MAGNAMDKERKRQLKRLGKDLVEKQSASLNEARAQTNTAPFASDEHLRNEIEIRKAERRLRTEMPRVQRVEDALESYVFWPKPQPSTLDRGDDREYWHCTSCSHLVPSIAIPATRCACGNVYTMYAPVTRSTGDTFMKCTIQIRDRGAAELVQLLPKARTKRWWQFWR